MGGPVTERRGSHRLLEHRYERAGALIAHFQSDRCYRLPLCQQAQRLQQPKLLTPAAEPHAGFSSKSSFEGAFAGAGFPGEPIE